MVVALLTKETGELLLTMRPGHMRTFPNVWVVPGGGIDPGETLMEAAARELLEETGITMPQDAFSLVGWVNMRWLVLCTAGHVIGTCAAGVS